MLGALLASRVKGAAPPRVGSAGVGERGNVAHAFQEGEGFQQTSSLTAS